MYDYFMKTLYLPEQLRSELKKVWGVSIFGKEADVLRNYQNIVKQKDFKKIITVGDYCSAKLFSHVKIFDGKVERQKVEKTLAHILTCDNAAGTIQAGVWQVLQTAISKNQNVFVNGEEDMLVIPVVLLSENGFAVVYGFPQKGICVIEVSDKIKKSFEDLMVKFITK